MASLPCVWSLIEDDDLGFWSAGESGKDGHGGLHSMHSQLAETVSLHNDLFLNKAIISRLWHLDLCNSSRKREIHFCSSAGVQPP